MSNVLSALRPKTPFYSPALWAVSSPQISFLPPAQSVTSCTRSSFPESNQRHLNRQTCGRSVWIPRRRSEPADRTQGFKPATTSCCCSAESAARCSGITEEASYHSITFTLKEAHVVFQVRLFEANRNGIILFLYWLISQHISSLLCFKVLLS